METENKYNEEDLALYATLYKISLDSSTFKEWFKQYKLNIFKKRLLEKFSSAGKNRRESSANATEVTVTPIAVPEFYKMAMYHAAVVNTMPTESGKTRWIDNISKEDFKVKESIAIKNDYSTIPNDMSYLIAVGLFVQAYMNSNAEWSYRLYKLPEQCDIDFARSGECVLPSEYLSPVRIISPEISVDSYNEAMHQGIKFAKEYIKKLIER